MATKELTKAQIRKKEKAKYNKQLQEWKKAVRERDNYLCQQCRKDLSDNLRNCHPHHILDKKNFKEYSLDTMNGITLCYWCHKVGGLAPHMNAIYFSEWLKANKPGLWRLAKIRLENNSRK